MINNPITALTRRRFLLSLAAVSVAATAMGLTLPAPAGPNTQFWYYRLDIPWDLATGRIISWPDSDFELFQSGFPIFKHPPNIVFSPDGRELFLYS